MAILKRFLPLAAVLVVALTATGVDAEAGVERAASRGGQSSLRDVLSDGKYDVDSEFADFDEIDGVDEFGRRLQFRPNPAPAPAPSNGSSTTHCNTWCKLKEAAAQTIIGLLLICLA